MTPYDLDGGPLEVGAPEVGDLVRCEGCGRPIIRAALNTPHGWVHAEDDIPGCDNGGVVDGEWCDQTFAAPRERA